VLSTLLVASGWVLSALHQLNRLGYAVVFALAALAFIYWQRRTQWLSTESIRQSVGKFRKRFKRSAPLFFLVLVLMSLAGSVLYINQNSDSNEYRIPRVWHWLAEGRWHWIHTFDNRMNIAGCGLEWLYAPIMLFTRTDRAIFLANWVSYLMLPGMTFSVLTRLGVRSRVAWWWMWLLPSGWCYVLQAGAIINDSFGVIYALASVDFALRAREKNYLPDLWLSLLALALLSGVKQTNLPLILPGLAAVLLCFRMIKIQPLATLGVCVLALLVSAFPLFYLTYENMGEWASNTTTIGSATYVWKGYDVPPFWGFVGNIFCLTAQNLHPPYFPWADRWNAAMQHFLQTPMGSHFRSFESFGMTGPGVVDSNSGIGLWICLLTAISICAAKFYRGVERPVKDGSLGWLRWVPFVSLLIFMAKVGTYQNARQLASYYVLFFPALLVAGGHAALVRKKWWQYSVLTTMLLTAAMLIVARDRPLFPARSILLPLTQKHPEWHFLSKAWDSYACRFSVEAQRNAFRDTIPAGERVIGYATVRGSQEPGQWVPFGRRRVERVLPTDAPAQLWKKDIHFVLLDSAGIGFLQMGINDWTNQFNGVLIDSITFESNPGTTATDYLVQLNPPGAK
jgi:hypothetical protein